MTTKQVLEQLRQAGYRVDYPGLCYLFTKGYVPSPPKDGSGRRLYSLRHLKTIKAALDRRR